MLLKKMNLNKCFDSFIIEEIRKYADRINRTDADIIILMARKAAVFFHVLIELGYIKSEVLQKTIITDRVFNQDNLDFTNKKIALVDDIIISGSTIALFLQKLNALGCKYKDIEILVLAINSDTERMYFVDPITGYEILDKNQCLYLSDVECTKLCGDISRALSLLGKPYDIDFPSYHKLYLNKRTYKRLLLFTDWKVFNVSNIYHIAENIDSITLIPNEKNLKEYFKIIKCNLTNLVTFKIRLYSYQNGNEVIVKFVPMAMINEMSYFTVCNLFNYIVEESSILKSSLKSITAKVKFLQFYFAYHLMNYFEQGQNLKLEMHEYSIRYLFGKEISNEVLEIIKRRPTSKLMFKMDNKKYIEPATLGYKCPIVQEKTNLDIFDINEYLFNPFIYWYKEKEKDARESMRIHDFNFDSVEKYTKNIKRLTQGFSINFFKKLCLQFDNQYQTDDLVSIFIDRAVDMGVIVPILYDQEYREVIVRGFRHGEDLPFEEADKNRLLYFIEKFLNGINKSNEKISQTNLQLIISLFFRFALNHTNPPIFNCFLGFSNFQVVSTKYLNGRAIPSIINKSITVEEIKDLSVLYEKKNYIQWLIKSLEDENYLRFDDKGNVFINCIDSQFIQNDIAKTVQNKITLFANIFSSWYTSYSEKYQFKETISILLNYDSFDHKMSSLMSILNACVKNTEQEIMFRDSFGEMKYKSINNVYEYFDNNYKNSVFNQTLNFAYSIFGSCLNKNSFKIAKNLVYGILEEKNSSEAVLWDDEWQKMANENETIEDIKVKNLERTIYYIMKFHLIYYKLFEKNNCESRYTFDYFAQQYKNIIDKFEFYKPQVKDLKKHYENRKDYELLEKIPLKKSKELIENFKIDSNKNTHILLPSLIVVESKSFDKDKYLEIKKCCMNYNQDVIPFIISGEIDRILIGIHNYNFTENLEIFKNIMQYISKSTKRWRAFIIHGLSGELVFKVPIYQNKENSIKLYNEGVINNFIKELGGTQFYNEISYFYTLEYNTLNNIINMKNNAQSINDMLEIENDCKKIECIGRSFFMTQYLQNNRIKIAVITVISEESRAVRDEFNLQRIKDRNFESNTSRSFYFGILETDDTIIEIYQTACSEQGNVAATEVAMAIRQLIEPDYYILLGVAGSINEKKLEECDVIIAQNVFDGQLVKETELGNEYSIFSYRSKPRITSILNDFITEKCVNEFTSFTGSKRDTFRVVYANICDNGNLIVNKDSEFIQTTSKTNRKIYAIEMEASGVCKVIENEELDTTKKVSKGLIIIRGISDIVKDLQNKPENNKWHYYAARNAAIVLKELLKHQF